MRKRIIESGEKATPISPPEGLDIASIATVLVTSESAEHPVENAFDARRGPGGSRWVAGTPGEQTVVLEFDEPRSLRGVALEIEEKEVARTQELTLAVSTDGGKTYRDLVRQEFNFSPGGSTFERESWQVEQEGVTHLKLGIRPDKGGVTAHASLTSLSVR